jgi:hypothetical protein
MVNRSPKFIIPTHVDKVASLLDQYQVSDKTLEHALNAASKGVVRMGLDPVTCEMALAVRDRVSPALETLAIEFGECKIAAAVLFLLGAAIEGDLWKQIRDLVE